MNAAQKYSYCICFGVFAEIVIPILSFFALNGLYNVHIQVSPSIFAALSFPYLFIADWLNTTPHADPIIFIVLFASLIQWPVYGWILGRGWARQQFLKYAVILSAIHITTGAVAYCFYWSSHPFDPWKGCFGC